MGCFYKNILKKINFDLIIQFKITTNDYLDNKLYITSLNQDSYSVKQLYAKIQISKVCVPIIIDDASKINFLWVTILNQFIFK